MTFIDTINFGKYQRAERLCVTSSRTRLGDKDLSVDRFGGQGQESKGTLLRGWGMKGRAFLKLVTRFGD